MSHEKEVGRRTFCLQACQAASCLAIGSLVEACGGGGSSPSNVSQLATVNGSVTGRVVNGPASAPLRTFATQFSNNVLTISL